MTHPVELSVGTNFNSWEIAEHYLKEYGKQKGFVVKKYQVEYTDSTNQIPNFTETLNFSKVSARCHDFVLKMQ